jgi:methylthioribose-1-phosphate isomerase
LTVSIDGAAPPESGPMPDEPAAGETAEPERDDTEGPTPEVPADPTRRQFFRQFAGEVLTGAATVVGAVTELRDRSAAEAAVLLGDPPRARGNGTSAAGTSDAIPGAAAPDSGETEPQVDAVFRTPFRFESDNVLLVIDQRQLPDRLVEVPVRTASDAASAIKLMVVRGAPAIGQVAAIGLALTGRIAAKSQPHARRAILEGNANALRQARPTAVNLRWAVDRLMARYHAIGDLSPDGAEIAAAMDDEAMAIVAEANDDHGRLAEAGLTLLPRPADRPLNVLTHCHTGPLAAGQFGTALGVVQAAHAEERPLHVWVDETRPYLQGARITAWELGQAGVPHTLIPDMAAGPLLAQGQVDVILVGADRIAANGDTANKIGTYTLAVLAQRHGVPFIVCAPLSSVDLETPDGAAIPIEDRAASEVTEIRGVRIAPAGTDVRNPAFDVTPAELITAIVTEEGVVRPPFGEGLRAAMERRAARRVARREADRPYPIEPAPVEAD